MAIETTNLVDAVCALAPLIREHADEGERSRTTPAPVIDALADAGVFLAWVPRELGGLEVDFITLLDVIQEVSRADGSTGWVTMIGSSAGAFAGWFPEDGAREIYSDRRAIMAGAVAPNGSAVPVDGGYRVTGRWAFISGCQHSSWLGGSFIHQPEGGPLVWKFAIFPRHEVRIVDTWTVSGLAGTGSHDIEVKDVFVPEARLMPVLPEVKPWPAGPLYRMPIMSVLAPVVGAVALGIARAAIDDLVELASKKTPTGGFSSLAERPLAQLEVARAEAELRSARALLHETMHNAWEKVSRGDELSIHDRALVRIAATNATRSGAAAVDRMYAAAGGSSIYTERSRLQRHFRDVHAATQHIATAAPTEQTIGRVLLGLDLDSPIF
jgi:alkylation response protein AidB-like acyl-CoA dehydrogenase